MGAFHWSFPAQKRRSTKIKLPVVCTPIDVIVHFVDRRFDCLSKPAQVDTGGKKVVVIDTWFCTFVFVLLHHYSAWSISRKHFFMYSDYSFNMIWGFFFLLITIDVNKWLSDSTIVLPTLLIHWLFLNQNKWNWKFVHSPKKKKTIHNSWLKLKGRLPMTF